MLTPDDPLSRGIAAAIAVGLVALLIWRAIRKDRREYSRFRRYRSSAKRRAMMRRWLIESLLLFGGSAIVLAAVVHPLTGSVLEAARAVGWVAAVVGWLSSPVGMLVLALAAALAVALTIVGVRSARREGGVVMIGDIAALLPRNRPELGWASALAVNAGVVEELLFRLCLPALLFVVTGEPLSAFGLAALLFAALHAYQGVPGVIGTLVVGLLLTAAYVLSGSVVVAIVLHALLDLRTLVLVPVAVYDVHRVPGTRRFPPALAALSLSEPEPEPEPEPTAEADADADAETPETR
ncbi:CPBP family intramembrane glutamic endopeptidase [Yonghaparkia sp. Soil809]|uniref:CPBP family intramembrane glutamic endopeptidase n=1 Tax=Yonghaparkia sp. Soil809 TaxID=1736417 RepID=UPI0006FB638D|nr:CPBP family intramembrane glutamic endopeptidase [Yonghaparkia sp. Soil809]KRF32837.1 hypothetical protein ASG83_02065 [Yonghaparkia sp. Soil809]